MINSFGHLCSFRCTSLQAVVAKGGRIIPAIFYRQIECGNTNTMYTCRHTPFCLHLPDITLFNPKMNTDDSLCRTSRVNNCKFEL